MTSDSFALVFANVAYGMKGVTKESRHRMSKELAEELRDQMGDNAYLFCVEKLSNGTTHPQLWRDVLTWLTETETTKGESK